MTSHRCLRAPANLYVKEKKGKFLVLNPNVPAWLVTNQLGVFILRFCDGDKTKEQITNEVTTLQPEIKASEIIAFLDYALSKNIFEVTKPKHSRPSFALKSLYLNITEDCNLDCIYCYAQHRKCTNKSLGFDDYCRILDSARRVSNDIIVTFTGGEPLTSSLLFDIARYARKQDCKTFLLTNGTLISPENVALVVEMFDEIKISIDGSTAEINDQTRGEGTFNRVCTALDLLDGANKPYSLSMTVTRLNIHDVGEMSKRFGGKLSYAPYFHHKDDAADVALGISGEEYFNALTKGVGVNPYCQVDSLIAANIENRVIQKCSIADGSISIASNGDVYPCQLLHFPEFKAGNVKDQSFEDIYQHSPVLKKLRQHTVEKIEGCDTCPIALLCGGGCIARHYYETGSLSSAGCFCEYEQLAILDALLDRHELQPIGNLPAARARSS